MSAKPGAEQGEEADEEGSDDDLDLAACSVEGLRAAGDAEALFALGRASRQGTHGRSKDLATSLAAYAAAGDLGHADADYAAALFYMSGTGAPRDPREAAARLRRAADRGSLDAKIYVGNLYELGVHYTRDPEKADVWYRNAARAAGVTAAPGSPALARALAGLGAVRYADALATDPEVPAEERETAARKARARGGSLRERASTTPAPERSAAEAPAAAKGADASASAAPTRAEASASAGPRADDRSKLAELAEQAKPPSPVAWRAGIGKLLYALLFAGTALGAAFAADAGARELASHGTTVPLFGKRLDMVFPVVLGLVGVLPQLLVYRAAQVARAAVVGAASFGLGWVLHGTGKLALTQTRLSQAMAFAGAALLTTLFVQGLARERERVVRRAA